MNRKLLLIASAALLLFSCAGNPVSQKSHPEFTSDYVALIQKPDYPTVFIYTICKDSVFCDMGFSHREAWSTPTIDFDFDSLSALIFRNGICGMADQTVMPDSSRFIVGCWGYGLQFRANSCCDTINAACLAIVPATFKEVVDSVQSKVNKYKSLAGWN